GEIGGRLELIGSDLSESDLDANHVAVGCAPDSINAVLQSKALEVIGVGKPAVEPFDFIGKPQNLGPDFRCKVCQLQRQIFCLLYRAHFTTSKTPKSPLSSVR